MQTNGTSLAVAQVIGLLLQLRWLTLVNERHPFAAVVPVGLIVSTMVLLLSGILTFRPRKATAAKTNGICVLMPSIIATVAGAVLFLLAGWLRLAPPASVGRLLSCMVYLAITTPFVVIVSQTLVPEFAKAVRHSSWFRRTATLMFGVGVFGILLFSVEIVCGLIIRTRPLQSAKVYEGDYLSPGAFYRHDQLLGTALEPSRKVHSRLTIDNRLVWDVDYSTDPMGRRTTIHPEGSIPEKFAVFFGCSFLFGEGATDSETIPSQFSALAPSWRAYNYGVPGYGTQQMLAILESNRLKDQVSEKTGVAIYLYLPEVHEARVVGEMDVVNSFASEHPFYELDRDGQPTYRGSFRDGRPLTTGLYDVLGKSQLVRCLGLNFPKRTQAHYELLGAMVAKSRRLFLEQFPEGRFIVAQFPGTSHRLLQSVPELTPDDYPDLCTLFDPSAPEYHFVGDGHPTPLANRAVAEKIAACLYGHD